MPAELIVAPETGQDRPKAMMSKQFWLNLQTSYA